MKKIWLLLLVMPIISNGQKIKTIAGNGTIGYAGDGGSAILGEFNNPTSIRFDHAGNMYIADWRNNVIRKINSSGIITTVAGNGYGAGIVGVGGYTGDNGQATAGELNGPVDVAFDAEGNMYIDDNDNSVIRKVNNLGIITTIAGIGTFGYNGDEIPATTAKLNYPAGLAFDNAGNLYFADEDNSRVRKINASGIISTVAGNGTSGYNGDGIPATNAQLRQPVWVAVSPSGDLYIPDWTDYRVRKVSSSGIISTVAGNGNPGVDGDGGPATAASISRCSAIVFDNSGNFFISNDASCSIRKVDTHGIITTVVGNDTCGFNGDGGPATAAEIKIGAICSAVDASGNLYIADCLNNRIRRVTYNATAVDEVSKTPQNANIYPNPANNRVTISAGEKIESVAIINLIGQEMSFGEKLTMTSLVEVSFSIAELPNGVYFVKVNGVYGGKFVKE